jgi:hypothetical protein
MLLCDVDSRSHFCLHIEGILLNIINTMLGLRFSSADFSLNIDIFSIDILCYFNRTIFSGNTKQSGTIDADHHPWKKAAHMQGMGQAPTFAGTTPL